MGSTTSYLNYEGKTNTEEEPLVNKLNANAVSVNNNMTWLISNYQSLDEHPKIELLNSGCTFFSVTCSVGNNLQAREKNIINSIINMSYAFENEVEENGVPFLDINDNQDMGKYTIIVTKVSYLLAGVKIQDISPEIICSEKYISQCVPGNPKIWPQEGDTATFRITKSIIPYIYSITVQLKVSEITREEDLKKLSIIDNVPVDRAFIMERTKRSKNKVDSTVKAKSILSYKKVDGGLLVTNVTVVLNTKIPSILSKFSGQLGSYGCKEAGETCYLTRKYFMKS